MVSLRLLVERGGPVMWPLMLCSIISLTIVLERSWFWVRERQRRNRRAIQLVLALADRGQYHRAQRVGALCQDSVVRVLSCGIAHRHYSLMSALEMQAKVEVGRMRRYLPVLDTLVTLAPLLGIFGTVTGIIMSFDMLGQSAIADPQAVTQGIAQALLTTATGLAVAMVSLIPYNYFSRQADEGVADIERYASSLELLHQQQVVNTS